MASKEMGLLVAVRDYINTNGGPQVVLSEMLPFKKACSEEDKASTRWSSSPTATSLRTERH